MNCLLSAMWCLMNCAPHADKNEIKSSVLWYFNLMLITYASMQICGTHMYVCDVFMCNTFSWCGYFHILFIRTQFEYRRVVAASKRVRSEHGLDTPSLRDSVSRLTEVIARTFNPDSLTRNTAPLDVCTCTGTESRYIHGANTGIRQLRMPIIRARSPAAWLGRSTAALVLWCGKRQRSREA